MTRTFLMKSTIFSLFGETNFVDSLGQLVYQARGNFDFFYLRWRLSRQGNDIACVERSRFSLRKKWKVSGETDPFIIRRDWLSIYRTYSITDGPLHGCKIKSDFTGLNLSIKNQDKLLARAKLCVFSMVKTWEIEIEDPDAEATCIIAMLVIDIDRQHNFAQAAADTPPGQYTPG